jgi:hypothetical protein
LFRLVQGEVWRTLPRRFWGDHRKPFPMSSQGRYVFKQILPVNDISIVIIA